jgi:hypothetical protein
MQVKSAAFVALSEATNRATKISYPLAFPLFFYGLPNFANGREAPFLNQDKFGPKVRYIG